MKLLVALAAVFFLTYGYNAYAEPRYQASVQGIVVTLHTEKCAIAEVSNLPYRATWMENGKMPTAMFRAVQGV